MGILYLVSTPIGNLADITLRAIQVLLSVEIIACEDTRHTGQLLSEIKKRYRFIPELFKSVSNKEFVCDESINYFKPSQTNPKLIRFDDKSEFAQIPELINILSSGSNVALVSDAGTPLISDPGYKLVNECLKRNIKVTNIPGPTAFISALVSSGLPANNILFLGYPPEKPVHRVQLFQELHSLIKTSANIKPTISFYCAPHKLLQTLDDLNQVFGNISIVISRELTKIHEESWRGSISEAKIKFSDPKGELVLLFNFQKD